MSPLVVKKRGRERKTTKGTFSLENMNKAVDLVLNEGYSVRKAAKLYELAHKTVDR